MIVLADTYIIFDNKQHCIVCVGNAACALKTMAKSTYYMFDPHSCDVTWFQNDNGTAVLLHF